MSYVPIAVPDESAFVAGTSPVVPVGGVWNDALAALTTGQIGQLRITEKRAAHTNLRNETGTELATASAPLRTDPTGTTKQPVTLFDSAGTAITLSSGRLLVDGSGVTQPISAASLPLPAGASTAAKQPALGTAGTPSADVITVQGRASMTPLSDNLTQLAGTAIDVNSGNKSAGTLRVILATDQPALTTPLPASGYLHSSGDVIAPVRAGGKIAASGAFGSSTTPVTLVTAPGGQYYYVKSIKFDIDPSVHFSNVFLVSVNDSTDGLIAQWLIFPPSSSVVPTSPIVLTYLSPAGFFYIPSTTATTLSCKPNNALAAGYLYITVNYGLTSIPG